MHISCAYIIYIMRSIYHHDYHDCYFACLFNHAWLYKFCFQSEQRYEIWTRARARILNLRYVYIHKDIYYYYYICTQFQMTVVRYSVKQEEWWATSEPPPPKSSLESFNQFSLIFLKESLKLLLSSWHGSCFSKFVWKIPSDKHASRHEYKE